MVAGLSYTCQLKSKFSFNQKNEMCFSYCYQTLRLQIDRCAEFDSFSNEFAQGRKFLCAHPPSEFKVNIYKLCDW